MIRTSTPTFAIFALLTALVTGSSFAASDQTNAEQTTQQQPLALHYFDSAAAQPNAVLTKLLNKADALKLAENDHWLRLLHFEKKRFSSWQSIVDEPSFFLSSNGKLNARDELRATLAGFMDSQELPPAGRSAQCKFPARFYWLNQKLDFANAGLAAESCPQFDNYMKAIKPGGITVIFAASHPGGPSSMFGHTLLRIDKENQTEALKMLAWGVSYAADSNAGTGNPVSYAVRGLAGGYPGRFSVMPYYLKMREYGQMEDRALWEYKLKLSPEQAAMIARHTYEMGSTWSSYYFFTENCSYLLLTMIDVALPGPRVSSLMTNWVIPADSIIALENAGLVESVIRQPGYNQIIRARRKSLSNTERRLALQLAADNSSDYLSQLEPLDNDRQAAVLDLAYDYRRYSRIRDTDQLDAKLAPAERALLARRAKLGGRSTVPTVPAATRPDKGHASQRAEVGVGHSDNQAGGLNFVSLGWRAAYHDLLDPQAGYRHNSRLEVFDVQARLYNDTGANRDQTKLELEQFDLFDILAIEPRDEFFKHWSWNARAGLRNTRIDSDIRTVTTFGGGAGQSFSLTENASWVGYGMLDGELDYATFLRSDYRLTAGPRLGLIGQLAANSRLHIEARHLWQLAGAEQDNWSVNVGFAQQLTDSLNLKAELSRASRFGQRNDQFLLTLQRYY